MPTKTQVGKKKRNINEIKELLHSFTSREISDLRDNPQRFLLENISLSQSFLNASKELFSLDLEEDSKTLLSILYIEDRDADQIWEQLNFKNSPLLKKIKKKSDAFISLGDLKEETFSDGSFSDISNNSGNLTTLDSDNSGDENIDKLDYEINEESEREEDDFAEVDVAFKHENNNGEEEVDEYADEVEDGVITGLDDGFFSLADMERFADRAEKFDYKKAGEKIHEDDKFIESGEEEDDLFDMDPEYFKNDPDEIADDDENEGDNANEIYFEDFFSPPKQICKSKINVIKSFDSELDQNNENHNMLNEYIDENLEDEDPEEKALSSQIRNLFSNEDTDGENEEEEPEKMSGFESRQLKMQETIANLEAEAVAEKPWGLRGEVSSRNRPVNSLLEEHLEIDFSNKPVPVITEEVTQSLDALIKQRIIDQLFNDVERRLPPPEIGFDPSRRMEISDQKSSKGLGEVYEQEYMTATGSKAQSEKHLELEKQHKEINEMFLSLSIELDALCNWHYTPKPPSLEIQVIDSNVPAIQMEDIIPASVSSAALITPSEAYDGKLNKSSNEMTANEKTKARQRAKRVNRKETKDIEQNRKAEAKYKEKLGIDVVGKNATRKATKLEKAKALEGLMSHKNVTVIGNKGNEGVVKGKKKGKTEARIVGKGDSLRKEKGTVSAEMFRL
ncbi:u3 small nucleolar ribonucleoprotein MPP10 [Nowakowskiella sp. JEL0078]|nr:u3 small nucleolar ribonucleoprotein MPP10 [Nowakowskiella sp. JEL0078]